MSTQDNDIQVANPGYSYGHNLPSRRVAREMQMSGGKPRDFCQMVRWWYTLVPDVMYPWDDNAAKEVRLMGHIPAYLKKVMRTPAGGTDTFTYHATLRYEVPPLFRADIIGYPAQQNWAGSGWLEVPHWWRGPVPTVEGRRFEGPKALPDWPTSFAKATMKLINQPNGFREFEYWYRKNLSITPEAVLRRELLDQDEEEARQWAALRAEMAYREDTDHQYDKRNAQQLTDAELTNPLAHLPAYEPQPYSI